MLNCRRYRSGDDDCEYDCYATVKFKVNILIVVTIAVHVRTCNESK